MPHFGSPLGILRYNIEHKIIRSSFFDNPELLIAALIRFDNTIFEIYDDTFQKSGINNPYSIKDFCVEGVKFDPDGFFMRIKLPKPEFFRCVTEFILSAIWILSMPNFTLLNVECKAAFLQMGQR